MAVQTNIIQEKKRFTELTGIPATRGDFVKNTANNQLLVDAYRYARNNKKAWHSDFRCYEFWQLINEYIERELRDIGS